MQTITTALTNVPTIAARIAIDTWENEAGATEGIVWDRTGLGDQDGEGGNQLDSFTLDADEDHDDITTVAISAGWNIEDWTHYNLGDGPGAMAPATR